MAAKLSLILCVLAIWAFDSGYSAHHAPAPSADCSSLIVSMAECLSFVSNGSTVSKPEGTCCSGLKTVLKTDPACLCEAFKNSAQLGVVLNITKAMTLPAACKVSAPSVSKCGLAPSPAGAPAASPALSPKAGGGSASATAPASETGGATQKAPSPSPGNSASSMGFSAASLIVGLLVYSLSSF